MNKLSIGQHFWALMQGKLLVAIKTVSGYYVCGAWECRIPKEELTFIGIINPPSEYENIELYYND